MFICMQNINLGNMPFLTTLQKYYKLAILGTLDMSGHFYQKRLFQFVETLVFICIQKMNSIPYLFFKTL